MEKAESKNRGNQLIPLAAKGWKSKRTAPKSMTCAHLSSLAARMEMPSDCRYWSIFIKAPAICYDSPPCEHDPSEINLWCLDDQTRFFPAPPYPVLLGYWMTPYFYYFFSGTSCPGGCAYPQFHSSHSGNSSYHISETPILLPQVFHIFKAYWSLTSSKWFMWLCDPALRGGPLLPYVIFISWKILHLVTRWVRQEW